MAKFWTQAASFAGGGRLAAGDIAHSPKHTPKQVDGYVGTRIGFYHRKGYGADMIKEYLHHVPSWSHEIEPQPANAEADIKVAHTPAIIVASFKVDMVGPSQD